LLLYINNLNFSLVKELKLMPKRQGQILMIMTLHRNREGLFTVSHKKNEKYLL